jgi:hypothetical protein
MAASRMASVSVVIATALVGASGWSVASMLVGDAFPGGSGPAASLHGARLGQTVGQLRAAFTPPGGGSFRAAPGQAGTGDLALDWAPSPGGDVDTAPRDVRFEVHAGLLVAIRAILPARNEHAEGPALQVRDASVAVRRKNNEQTVSFTLLARDCPAHADEVRALLGARTD